MKMLAIGIKFKEVYQKARKVPGKTNDKNDQDNSSKSPNL